MAKRRRILLFLSLSSLSLSAILLSDDVATPIAIAAPDSARSLASSSNEMATRPTTDDGQPALSVPEETPVARRIATASLSQAPCGITAPPTIDLYRRQVNNQAVTIVFLSSALSSANSHAAYLSQSLASSISQLQRSLSLLSSASSSAVLSVQASASRVIQAVEASASDAILAAEESASNRVSEALATTGLTTVSSPLDPSNRTYQAQTVITTRTQSVSVAVVAGAVVASIVGSTLLSVLGFYVFVLRRRTKQQEREEKKKQEEEEQAEKKRQEDEVHVNAALDRAIVSYIAKESPSSISADQQIIGQAATSEDAGLGEQRPRQQYLSPPPTHAHRPRPSVAAYWSPPPQSPLREIDYSAITSPPPGPPPTGPLPQIPPRASHARKHSRKKSATRSSPDNSDTSDVYTEILTSPLERTATRNSQSRDDQITWPQSPRRRDSNWPLTGRTWV